MLWIVTICYYIAAFTLFLLNLLSPSESELSYGRRLPLLADHHLGTLEQIDQQQQPNYRYTTIMDPIPLRALTVLLNYERMISDPRFKDVKLWKSSTADRGLVGRVRLDTPSPFENVPSTIEYVQLLVQ
jgi:hypothetical protein